MTQCLLFIWSLSFFLFVFKVSLFSSLFCEFHFSIFTNTLWTFNKAQTKQKFVSLMGYLTVCSFCLARAPTPPLPRTELWTQFYFSFVLCPSFFLSLTLRNASFPFISFALILFFISCIRSSTSPLSFCNISLVVLLTALQEWISEKKFKSC